MSTQKAKFELFQRLQNLGFTFEESQQLRRIEMTLSRWAEREAGDGTNWAIERDETSGRPFMVYHGEGKARRYPIADREAGALRRLGLIVDARNGREALKHMQAGGHLGDKTPGFVLPYHQTDCRGCMVYLVTRAQLGDDKIDSVYNRGLAVCC